MSSLSGEACDIVQLGVNDVAIVHNMLTEVAIIISYIDSKSREHEITIHVRKAKGYKSQYSVYRKNVYCGYLIEV